MPYIVLTANGEEIDRHELTGPTVIGRSPECDVAVRDILLSRKHCRLEPGKGRDKNRWRLIDLDSRNGSHVNYKKVTEHTLVDGDVFRIGRTWVKFHAAKFEPAPESAKPRKSRLVRPADPHEALSGTVADFVFAEHDDRADQEFDATPSPMSKANDSLSGVKVYSPGSASIDDDLALSPKGTTVATATSGRPARRLARPIPRPIGEKKTGSQTSQTDLSLQARPNQVPFLEVVPEIPARKRNRLIPALILTAGICAATAAVLVSGWVLMK